MHQIKKQRDNKLKPYGNTVKPHFMTAFKVRNTKENEASRKNFLEFAEESNIDVVPTEDGKSTIYATNANSIPASILKSSLANYGLEATKLFIK